MGKQKESEHFRCNLCHQAISQHSKKQKHQSFSILRFISLGSRFTSSYPSSSSDKIVNLDPALMEMVSAAKVMLIFKHEFTVYYPSLSIFRHLQFTSIRDNCIHKLSVIKLSKLWIPYLAYEVLFKGCFSLLDFCKSGYF